MKKTFYTLVAFLAMNFSYAQEEMAPVWTAKLEHKVDLAVGMSDNLAMSYGASEKSITVVDNASGSVKWTSEFKTIIPAFKKVDEVIPLWDAKTMFLFDRKMGKDQMACVDINTGKLLWNTDKYQNISEDNVVYISELEAFALSLKESLVMVKARTGEEIWQTTKFKGVVGSYMYMSDGGLVMLNYKPVN
jgi:outer membrane protein assembly factor BamB